jgi:hypothetical protein
MCFLLLSSSTKELIAKTTPKDLFFAIIVLKKILRLLLNDLELLGIELF